jgi:N6-adenosine-specific RNA methylase IME4
MDVRVDAIMVGERMRSLHPEVVAGLVESMQRQGMLEPIAITYRKGGGRPSLVFGAHRLEAAKKLKWETIAATDMPWKSDDETLLAEIDENLIRGELSPAERADHVAKRKPLYERLHPETKHGGAPGAGRGRGKALRKDIKNISFVADIAKKTGRSEVGVAKDATRAKHIPSISRLVGTSLDKGEELDALVKLPKDHQDKLIARARNGEKVSAKPAAKQIKRAEREKELAASTEAASQELGMTLYSVIYADPPWRFKPYAEETGSDRAADNHYPTLTIDDIAEIELPAGPDCVLFMWVTVPMLELGIKLIHRWGFAYKTACAWVKPQIGTGYWFRNQLELLLVATRGNPPAPAMGEQPPQVITADRTKHSEKPEQFAEMIGAMFPNVAKLEMFARKPRDGWTVWGNEARFTPKK